MAKSSSHSGSVTGSSAARNVAMLRLFRATWRFGNGFFYGFLRVFYGFLSFFYGFSQVFLAFAGFLSVFSMVFLRVFYVFLRVLLAANFYL